MMKIIMYKSEKKTKSNYRTKITATSLLRETQTDSETQRDKQTDTDSDSLLFWGTFCRPISDRHLVGLQEYELYIQTSLRRGGRQTSSYTRPNLSPPWILQLTHNTE